MLADITDFKPYILEKSKKETFFPVLFLKIYCDECKFEAGEKLGVALTRDGEFLLSGESWDIYDIAGEKYRFYCIEHFVENHPEWVNVEGEDYRWLRKVILLSLKEKTITYEDLKEIVRALKTRVWSVSFDFYACGCGYFTSTNLSEETDVWFIHDEIADIHNRHLAVCSLLSEQ